MLMQKRYIHACIGNLPQVVYWVRNYCVFALVKWKEGLGVLEKLVGEIRDQFAEIREIQKCHSCECLLDSIEAVMDDLEKEKIPLASTIRLEMGEWLRQENQNRHPCLGCETCLPIEPYNRFSMAIRGLGAPDSNSLGVMGMFNMAKSDCGCGTRVEPQITLSEADAEWPVVKGDYKLGNKHAKVAVCTLGDTDLPQELETAGLMNKMALVGPLSTENLGIEKVIRNIVSNPSIGYLILCGKDSRGHKAGQAILSLKGNGVDRDGCIIGAVGPRPVLKNLSEAEIEAFRAYVDVIDEIGGTNLERLKEIIEQCANKPKDRPLSLPPNRRSPKVTVAERSEGSKVWEPDPEGFFVVLTDVPTGSLICEHYTTENVCDEVIQGKDATSIFKTVIRRGLLSRLDHAAYLGEELGKAEIALSMGLKYIQDKALQE